jgi:hypothetical protein
MASSGSVMSSVAIMVAAEVGKAGAGVVGMRVAPLEALAGNGPRDEDRQLEDEYSDESAVSYEQGPRQQYGQRQYGQRQYGQPQGQRYGQPYGPQYGQPQERAAALVSGLAAVSGRPAAPVP